MTQTEPIGTALRLFIAAPVSNPRVHIEMLNIRKRLHAAGYRYTPETQLHITLRFLGSVDVNESAQRDMLECLRGDLGHVAGQYTLMDLRLGRLRVWPGVLWIEVDDAGGLSKLVDLHKSVDKVVMEHGFEPADFTGFRFKPHITVGRFDRELTYALEVSLKSLEPPSPIEFQAESMEMLQSIKTPHGTGFYSPLWTPAVFGEWRRLGIAISTEIDTTNQRRDQ